MARCSGTSARGGRIYGQSLGLFTTFSGDKRGRAGRQTSSKGRGDFQTQRVHVGGSVAPPREDGGGRHF
eukprot:38045-Eustigmatos_ZCMA.PRE.1